MSDLSFTTRFEECDPSDYLQTLRKLRVERLLSTPTHRELDLLMKFANVREVISVILIGSRYKMKKYPPFINTVSWWPWIEFVIFRSTTGNWWATASGNTSRLREVHNTLVDYIYTGGKHRTGNPEHIIGTTVVIDMDNEKAKAAVNSPVCLMGYDIGINYSSDIHDRVRGKPFVAYSSILAEGRWSIYLFRYPHFSTPVTVLF